METTFPIIFSWHLTSCIFIAFYWTTQSCLAPIGELCSIFYIYTYICW